MLVLLIECISYVICLVASLRVFVYKKKTFRYTILRKNKNVYDLISNFGIAVLIGVFILFYILNGGLYEKKQFLESNELLFLVSANQLVFWSAVAIYGLSFKYAREGDFLEFDYPPRSDAQDGQIKLGTIVHKEKRKYDFYLSIKDLERHMFITGATGSGKSNFFQNFIVELKCTKQLKNIPILLVEFKGEYYHLQNEIDNLLVYQVGDNFAINIFDPLGVNPDVHAERVFEIFKSGGLFEGDEYSPQMERVFVEILRRVCKDPSKRNWRMFYREAKSYLKEMIREDITFKSSVQAVENRIRKYSLSTIAHSFEQQIGLNVKEVFKHNVLLNFKSLFEMGGNKEIALFFLNMMLKYLWDVNIERGSKDYRGIRHFIVVEDAQYFASQHTTKKSTISAYIEDIALLLRGTGECLISLATRPAVSPEILANCGVFITFQNHIQKDYLQDLLNFDREKERYLSMLTTGRCLVRVNSIGVPFELTTPYVKRSWLSEEEIKENNARILSALREEYSLHEQKENSTETIVTKFNKDSNQIDTSHHDSKSKIPEKSPLCLICKSPKESNSDLCEECLKFAELNEIVNKLYLEEQNQKARDRPRMNDFSRKIIRRF